MGCRADSPSRRWAKGKEKAQDWAGVPHSRVAPEDTGGVRGEGMGRGFGEGAVVTSAGSGSP